MKIRILVVEDEQHIGQMIEAALGLAGYECEVCDNGQDAVEKVRKSHYDLMLLDIMLPRMNGFEVMEEVKSRYCRTSNSKCIKHRGFCNEIACFGYSFCTNPVSGYIQASLGSVECQ